jgi:hypothetical protein
MLKSIEFNLVYPLYLAGFQGMIVWEEKGERTLS